MGLTHPANMSPEMRRIQQKAGLLCDVCGGDGETVLSHGIQHPPTRGKCTACKGTGRKLK